MLRLIYKTILISIISSVLMMGDLVSYADTNGTVVQGSDGTYSKTNTYDFKEVKPSEDGAMNILMMLALGAIATKLLMYKKWSYDMMAAAAGGAAYIVGEILNIANAKQEMNKISASITLKSDGTIDSTQVEYIKKLKESYQKLLDALKRKSMLLKVALAGFLVAAGIAAYQKVMITWSSMACTKAITAANTGFTAAAAACAKLTTGAVLCGEQVAACAAKMKPGEAAFAKLWSDYDVPLMSMAKASENAAPLAAMKTSLSTPCVAPLSPEAVGLSQSAAAACTPFTVQYADYAAFGHFASTANINSKPFAGNMLYSSASPSQMVLPVSKTLTSRSILKRVLGSMFENANAGYVSLLGLGAGAAAAYFVSEKYLGTYIDTILYSPGLRIAVWGVFTAFCMMAISDTEAKIKEVEANIEKIDRILNETSRLTKGIQASNASIQTVQLASDLFPNTDVTLSSTDKTGCLAGSTANGCTSTTALAGTNTTISDMPSGLVTATSQLTSVADAISGKGTISGATLSSATTVGKSANAIGKKVKQIQKKLNEVLVSNGDKPIDYDKDRDKLKSALTSRLSDALKSKDTTASGLLASIGMSPASSSPATVVGSSGAKKAAKATATTGKAAEKMPSFKLGDDAPNADVLANGMKEGTANDKYDIKGNDINGETGPSLFEVISQRYLKSGYPKLLEEDTQKK